MKYSTPNKMYVLFYSKPSIHVYVAFMREGNRITRSAFGDFIETLSKTFFRIHKCVHIITFWFPESRISVELPYATSFYSQIANVNHETFQSINCTPCIASCVPEYEYSRKPSEKWTAKQPQVCQSAPFVLFRQRVRYKYFRKLPFPHETNGGTRNESVSSDINHCHEMIRGLCSRITSVRAAA